MNIKRNLFICTLLMVGCHVLFTGCSSEEILNDNNKEEEQTSSDNNSSSDSENPGTEIPEENYVKMTFTSETNNKQGRASVVEDSNNGGKNILRWDAGDQVTVMTGKDINNLYPCVFTTDKGGKSSAFFEYVGPPVETKTYFGIHNATYYKDGKQTRFTIPTGNEDTPLCQTVKNSSLHLNKYRPMYTETQVSDENLYELTGLHFKHLSSLLVFTIINNSGKDATIRSIKTLAKTGNPFYNLGVRMIAEVGQSRTEQYTIPQNVKFSNYILLNLGKDSEGLTSSNGEEFQAYQSLLPVDFSSQPTDLEFYLNVNGKDIKALGAKSSDIGNKFKAGTYYTITLRIKEDEKIDVIIIENDIEDWEDGGNIIIPID